MSSTPGPWIVRDGLHGHPDTVNVEQFDMPVCRMQEWDDPAWQAANARLIAAAPDLVAALTVEDVEQIAEAIENFVMGPVEDAELNEMWQPYLDKLNALRAAILKATGR
jgi:hypothetical protein